MKNHHGGYVVVDGYLYGSDDPGVLTCLDLATGEVKWADRSSGKCSIVCVDGLLYCRSETGLVSLVAAKPDGFELHGRFEQPERSEAPSWPHPVVADGRLYLRDQDKLLVTTCASRDRVKRDSCARRYSLARLKHRLDLTQPFFGLGHQRVFRRFVRRPHTSPRSANTRRRRPKAPCKSNAR